MDYIVYDIYSPTYNESSDVAMKLEPTPVKSEHTNGTTSAKKSSKKDKKKDSSQNSGTVELESDPSAVKKEKKSKRAADEPEVEKESKKSKKHKKSSKSDA